jgi:hypothetical protein
MGYCKGFMSTTNDQLIDQFVQIRDHPPEMPQNIMGIAPFALDYYTAQYDEFMAEQYYLNEK